MSLLFNVLFKEDVRILENIQKEIAKADSIKGNLYTNICKALEEIILPLGKDEPQKIKEWYNCNTLYSATYCFIAKSIIDAYEHGFGCVALPEHEKLDEIVAAISNELMVIFTKKTKEEWLKLKEGKIEKARSFELGGTTSDHFQIYEVTKNIV